MSPTPDGGLADLQQKIADLHHQLAASNAERDEALARESATAEILQVINSSPGDLAPVFDAMLEKAMRLCEANLGALYRFDGEAIYHLAVRGASPETAELLKQSVRIEPESAIGHLARSGDEVIHNLDITADEIYRAGVPSRLKLVEITRARTVLWVALRKDVRLLGVFVIYRQEVRPFTDKQIALLQNFAAQAVIAMENARLLTETREALEQQTATAEVLGVINSSPGDLAPVFNAMLDRAVRLCAATYGHFRTYDGQGFPLAAVRGEGGLVVMHHEFRHFVPGPHNPISRFLRGENIIRIADAAADAAYRADQGWRALVDTGACRSVLAIALRKEAALLGYISVYRDQVRPFSEKDIALLQNFAAQAVIAMENARLLTETREALAQQTATAEVLQVINSSPGDLPPVFDAMLERAMRLCGAEFGEFFVTEGEQLRAVAVRGAPAEFVEFRHRNPAPPTPGSITSRILAGEPVIHVADVKDDDLYRRGDPHRRALVELAGARTFVSVTLLKDRVPLGSINIYRQEIRPFSDKQIALLQNFAAQAVIAMENARLLTETREALEQQTATAEVLGVINSSPGELAPVFDAMLEKAIRVCSADAGVLLTYDGDYFTPVAHRGVAEFPRDWYPVRSHPETGSGRLAHGEDIVHIIDSASGAPVEARDPGRLAMLAMGARTQLAAALRKEGKLLGSFTIWRREVRPFSDKQIALLENFAAQAVIAMENARLLGELRQRTDEVAELNRGLEARVAEQVDELGRVGRLKRFLAPQLAELIVSQGDENILASHRREIVVVFCDLRGYTAFTETAEPEEVLDFLREYHGALGPLVSQFEGTLDQFSGDGIMVFFNDPVPIPDPAERAVRMAMTMREAAGALIAYWRRRDRELGFGAGIAQGYATLGQIGFAERSGYTAIGTVCNLAARLCAEAKNGQILITGRVAAAVERVIALEDLGSLALKGLTQPVSAFNVPLAATPPALRVIEGGPQSV